LTDRLSQPQKVVIVVALGMALAMAGAYVAGLGNATTGGWYAYTPIGQGPFSGAGVVFSSHTRLRGWERLLIWLVLISLWALVSARVLRPSPGQSPHA
jgi:hypothetical protein